LKEILWGSSQNKTGFKTLEWQSFIFCDVCQLAAVRSVQAPATRLLGEVFQLIVNEVLFVVS
jgi:hypothetical protein